MERGNYEIIIFKKQYRFDHFTKTYYQTVDEVISSDNFKFVLVSYVEYLHTNDIKAYRWLVGDNKESDVVNELIKLSKLLSIIDFKDIEHPLLKIAS